MRTMAHKKKGFRNTTTNIIIMFCFFSSLAEKLVAHCTYWLWRHLVCSFLFTDSPPTNYTSKIIFWFLFFL